MVRIVFISLFIFVSGCLSRSHLVPHQPAIKSIFKQRPPEFSKFAEIHAKPYSVFNYDCSNMSAEYCDILLSNGYVSNVLIIDYDGKKKTKLIYSPATDSYVIERHAIVRVLYKKMFWYCDPANLTWSTDITDFAPDGLSGITRVVDPSALGIGEFSY